MVAKITFPKSIKAALNYNENKVKQGAAACLLAANYLKEAGELNFYQKLAGFERLNSLNERATTKTLHVSLNFDPSEKLSAQKLLDIATTYMEKIGFGEQPYLVYKHLDAGHPHIHIVSSIIKEDGSRINTHNIGRNQSEIARKEMEIQFGLVKAERQQQLKIPGIRPIEPEKLIYGKSETKRGITNIVAAVYSQYKFGSLPEFNAVLKQFNVLADRGREDGRIYKHRGLVFRVLDKEGNKLGVPIKASSIACQPTLSNLEKKFAYNLEAKLPFKQSLKQTIDECLESSNGSMQDLIAALTKNHVYTLLRQNTEGRLYGISFVDNRNKIVFNGSDLGRGYSAGALQSRLAALPNIKESLSPENPPVDSSISTKGLDKRQVLEKRLEPAHKQPDLLELLLPAKQPFDYLPNNLLKKKKRKKKTDRNF